MALTRRAVIVRSDVRSGKTPVVIAPGVTTYEVPPGVIPSKV